MLLTHISVRNFKTYLNLELDLNVSPERPIILIGGANGGGKSTLFQAIYGALYGLDVKTEAHFRELLNDGVDKDLEKNARIELEIKFTGKILQQDKNYRLKRVYTLNPERKVVQSVSLSMDGNIFTYGSASPPAQVKEHKAAIDKIIKANLPHELSRYFLFDALEAGDLLKRDQLNRVIRDNIENVMGFKKYYELVNVSRLLYEDSQLQRQKDEKARLKYQELLTERDQKEERLKELDKELNALVNYAAENRDLYNSLREGKNQDAELEKRLQRLQREIEDIETSEKEYHDKLNDLTSRIEDNLCFPHLQASVLDDTRNAIRVRQQEQSQGADLSPETITKLVQAALEYLNRDGLLVKAPDPGQVIEFIKSTLQPQKSDNPYAFLDADELKELEKLINQSFVNEFPSLLNRQVGLNQNLVRLDDLRREYEDTRKRIIKTDYALIKEFEEKDTLRRRLEDERTKLLNEIDKIKDRLAQYDIDVVNEPDARHDTLQKLPTFFERVANRLLLNKKRQIEETMLADLNINLNAYHNVIDRVELSDHLRDLTFKIFHKAGNEIHLNQLNTASKQVVIQVLLKALHELGDYDPPVMIDTVMGALDRESRATILESYFPKLAHQTILLSSDSEIDPETDYYKIKPFISKSYTLQRDRELQQTTVVKGYFN